MADDCAASVQACALRVARLAADGVPAPGARNLYVTEGIIQFQATKQVVQGDDHSQKNGKGGLCVRYKTPDVVERYNCTLSICAPEADLEELLVGGEALGDGGYKWPKLGEVERPDGVSLEVWSLAVVDGEPAAVNPYWWYAMPRSHWTPGRDVVLENGISAVAFDGWLEENPNWFDGPNNDWTEDSDRAIQRIRTDSYPAGVCGAQALAAS